MKELLHEDSLINTPRQIEIDTVIESVETIDYEFEDDF